MIREAMSHFTDGTFTGYCSGDQRRDVGHMVR